MFLPCDIRIGSMTLNNSDHGSTVSFGTTKLINRNVKAKKTQGFGQQFSDFTMRFSPIQMVIDDEMSDAFRMKKTQV